MNKHNYARRSVKGRCKTVQQIVWSAAYGAIPRNWHIHHINGNTLDNRLSNLMALSRPDHGRLHTGNYRQVKGVLLKRCIKCNRWYPVDRFYLSFQPARQKGDYVPYSYSSRCKACRVVQIVTLNRLKRRAG